MGNFESQDLTLAIKGWYCAICYELRKHLKGIHVFIKTCHAI